MEFKVNKKELVDALRIIDSVKPSGAIDYFQIKNGNLEIVRAVGKQSVSILIKGVDCLDGAAFEAKTKDVLKSVKNQSGVDAELHLCQKRAPFEFKHGEVKKEYLLTKNDMDKINFAKAFAATSGQNRPSISAVAFQPCGVVATNGSRLYNYVTKSIIPCDVKISSDFTSLKWKGDVKMLVCENFVVFADGTQTQVIDRASGFYPSAVSELLANKLPWCGRRFVLEDIDDQILNFVQCCKSRIDSLGTLDHYIGFANDDKLLKLIYRKVNECGVTVDEKSLYTDIEYLFPAKQFWVNGRVLNFLLKNGFSRVDLTCDFDKRVGQLLFHKSDDEAVLLMPIMMAGDLK